MFAVVVSSFAVSFWVLLFCFLDFFPLLLLVLAIGFSLAPVCKKLNWNAHPVQCFYCNVEIFQSTHIPGTHRPPILGPVKPKWSCSDFPIFWTRWSLYHTELTQAGWAELVGEIEQGDLAATLDFYSVWYRDHLVQYIG